MNGRGWIGWPIAGALSLGLHGVLAAATVNSAPEPQMDGGAVEGEIALGSGFADLVRGRSTPVVADLTPQAEPAKPQQVTAPVQPETARQPAPELSAETPAPQPTAMTPVKPVTQASPVTEITPVEPAAAPLRNAPPPKTLTARSDPPKAAPVAKPKPAPAAKGNAKAESRTGTSDGRKTGKLAEATAQKAKTNAKQAGDGAARSYQRSVLRQIARVPKRKAGAKGNALVGMVIAPSGAIASLRIVRSSGNDRIDRMALDTVRRAGPFGPTPDAGQMKLVVEMKSKG